MAGWRWMQRANVLKYLNKNVYGAISILRHFSSSQKFLRGDPSDIHPSFLDHGGEKCFYPQRDVNIESREIVRFGLNGKALYRDDVHMPFPSIRFKERNNLKLLEKEKGDWKKFFQYVKMRLLSTVPNSPQSIYSFNFLCIYLPIA